MAESPEIRRPTLMRGRLDEACSFYGHPREVWRCIHGAGSLESCGGCGRVVTTTAQLWPVVITSSTGNPLGARWRYPAPAKVPGRPVALWETA